MSAVKPVSVSQDATQVLAHLRDRPGRTVTEMTGERGEEIKRRIVAALTMLHQVNLVTWRSPQGLARWYAL